MSSWSHLNVQLRVEYSVELKLRPSSNLFVHFKQFFSLSLSIQLQRLPPSLPPSCPPLLLISPYIWKNSSISLCSELFRRSALALARSMLRILISATLWLRLCCSRLTRRTATCRSRTSLQRSNLQHTNTHRL